MKSLNSQLHRFLLIEMLQRLFPFKESMQRSVQQSPSQARADLHAPVLQRKEWQVLDARRDRPCSYLPDPTSIELGILRPSVCVLLGFHGLAPRAFVVESLLPIFPSTYLRFWLCLSNCTGSGFFGSYNGMGLRSRRSSRIFPKITGNY